MISIKKSKFSSISSSKAELPTNRKVAATSKKFKKSGSMESTSSMATGAPGVSVGGTPITIDMDPMLVGLGPTNYKSLFSLYRDMYYNDAVGGTAVDMLASLPFDDFTLGGISDNKVLNVFQENLERLSTKSLVPDMNVDFLALGSHTHSILYNKTSRKFVDVMPYAPENLNIKTLPWYGQEPIITATFSAENKQALATGSKRIERLKNLFGEDIFKAIQSGSLELDPLTTVYIPRKSFSDTDMGTSYLRRMLPIYLIEKNLYRGTLVESARRQRGILHITLDSNEEFIPTPDDMEWITNLFLDADSDPLGSIIATGPGISTEEVRQGGDFWKVTDFADSVLSQKLRALGLSEAFLSGDASYDTASQGVNVFVNMLLTHRAMFTRKFFYERLFPLISMLNGYTLNAKGNLVTKQNLMDTMTPEDALYTMADGSRLLIPSVTWSKSLKPDGDSTHLDLLNSLAEKGVPVPLRMLAAVGGLSIDELMRQQKDDLEVRKKIKEYIDEIAKLSPPPEGAEGGDGEETEGEEEISESSARITDLSKKLLKLSPKRRSAVRASKGNPALLNRNFGDSGELFDTTRTGKKKAIFNQRRANEKINLKISKSIVTANADKRLALRHTVSIKPKGG